MLISREKRETNIAEYILYMWQVEDTIRAFGFDIDRLYRELIDKYDQPEEVKLEMREWYENISLHMKNEKVEKAGHVQFIRNIINDPGNFHLTLLQEPGEQDYRNMYATVMPLIREMNARQKRSSGNEIETCLIALYIYMMMRLRKDPVRRETSRAMDMFIRFMAMLSLRFKAFEESEKRRA